MPEASVANSAKAVTVLILSKKNVCQATFAVCETSSSSPQIHVDNINDLFKKRDPLIHFFFKLGFYYATFVPVFYIKESM